MKSDMSDVIIFILLLFILLLLLEVTVEVKMAIKVAWAVNLLHTTQHHAALVLITSPTYGVRSTQQTQ